MQYQYHSSVKARHGLLNEDIPKVKDTSKPPKMSEIFTTGSNQKPTVKRKMNLLFSENLDIEYDTPMG